MIDRVINLLIYGWCQIFTVLEDAIGVFLVKFSVIIRINIQKEVLIRYEAKWGDISVVGQGVRMWWYSYCYPKASEEGWWNWLKRRDWMLGLRWQWGTEQLKGGERNTWKIDRKPLRHTMRPELAAKVWVPPLLCCQQISAKLIDESLALSYTEDENVLILSVLP